MNLINKIILLITIIFIISCDDMILNLDYELPFEEKLVIHGFYENTEQFIRVRISKSIPALQEPTLENTLVDDAECFIKFDNTEVKLIHTTDSYYMNELPIEFEIDKEYELNVKWKNKTAKVINRIPKLPEVISIDTNTVSNRYGTYLQVNLNVKSRDTGFLFSSHLFTNELSLNRIFSHTLLDNKNREYIFNILEIDYLYLSGDYMERYLDYEFSIGIASLDFNNYYSTRMEGYSGNDIFGNNGINVEGNIKGDAIGYWYGYQTWSGLIRDYFQKDK